MDLKNLKTGNELWKYKDQIKKIFFYRICGTGMGACACLMQQSGFEVEGADQNFYPPMSDYLESVGIKTKYLKDLNLSDLKEYDLIVVGNSVPGKSELARQIESLGVPFTSFPEILGQFILKKRNVIGIAGTHGKTTTTYLLKQLLEKLGQNPGYLIGGILNDSPPAEIGTSDYFIIESDEYDSAYFQKMAKFRLYEINKLILTSLEFDHADIYENVQQIEEEFKSSIGNYDYIIANDDYKSIQSLKTDFPKKNWRTYGQNQRPVITEAKAGGTQFSLGNDHFETSLLGEHNILNLSACIYLLLEEGFDLQDIKEACKRLSLVKRRQEYRGLYKGSIVIDDFAHHPRAVDLTTKAIQTQYPQKNIITVFEPVSATARSKIFQDEFKEALLFSKEVIIANCQMRTTAKNQDDLDFELLAKDLNHKGVCSVVVKDLKSLRHEIDSRVGDENLFLILSNRSCLGLWESDFVSSLA